MSPDLWEHGGDFPWLREDELSKVLGDGARSLASGATLWGSGRAALLGALEAGRASGWKRVLLPSYLCREVREAVLAAGWPVETYADHPLARPAGLPGRKLERGEVLLRVNTFGWRGAEESERALACGGAVIEDHTHDPAGPWARASRADFAFASLRKTTPVPDGAMLWKPSGEPAPAPLATTAEHETAAELKRRGMVGKRMHLAGTGPSEPRRFLTLGEERIGRGAPSRPTEESAALLERISPALLGEARLRSYERVVASPPFPREWLPPLTLPGGARPFALVLDLGSLARRDRVAAWLVRRRVFPSVLWPLGREADAEARAVSERTLAIACDFRHSEVDLETLARVLGEAFLVESSRKEGFFGAARSLMDRLRR
ncbi:hypothetical protein HY251_06120 [bacterium]|nr:hypothetical protein [bacterium]